MTTITGNNNDNRFSTTIAVNAGQNFALIAPVNNLQVFALGGNDTIDVGDNLLVSNATFQGGLGNDSIQIGSGGAINTSLFGGAGNDTISIGGTLTNSFIQSLTGNNTFATAITNLGFIQTGEGADSIALNGLTQFSTVRAGAGNDTITVNATTSSSIFGGDGNDVININGLLTSTLVQSLTGNNNIIGGVNGGLTGSTVETGSGTDRIRFQAGVATSLVRAGSANDQLTFTGTVSNSSIFAGQGNDTISLTGNLARTGSTFTTVTGDNRFVLDSAAATNAATANNSFVGGSGDDRLVITGTAITNISSLLQNNTFQSINTVETQISGASLILGNFGQFRGITNAVVGFGPGGSPINGDINASGYSTSITMTGGLGNDSLTGGASNDLINGGGSGTNSLVGGQGNDTIIGGLANDIIDGGAGADRMSGLAGADTFFQRTGESVAATAVTLAPIVGSTGYFANGSTFVFGNGVDVITGFSPSAIANDVRTSEDTVRFANQFTVADTNVTQFYTGGAKVGTIAQLFPGTLINSQGTVGFFSGGGNVAVTEQGFYVAGTFSNGTFTSNTTGNDALVFTVAAGTGATAYGAFNSAANVQAFFTGNASAFILDAV